MKYWILSLIFLALTGCSSSWEASNSVSTKGGITKYTALAAKTPRDGALIYLYRKSGFIGSASAWTVFLGCETLGSLKNGSFILVKVNPGTKILSSDEPIVAPFATGEKGLIFEAIAGKSYYFRHGRDKMNTSKLKFMPVTSLLAKTQLTGYKLVAVINKYKKTGTTTSASNDGSTISKEDSDAAALTKEDNGKEKNAETPNEEVQAKAVIENTVSEPEGDDKPKLRIVNHTGETLCYSDTKSWCSKQKEKILNVPWINAEYTSMGSKAPRTGQIQVHFGGSNETTSTGWTRIVGMKYCEIRNFKHKAGTVTWNIYNLKGGIQHGCSNHGFQQPNWNPKR